MLSLPPPPPPGPPPQKKNQVHRSNSLAMEGRQADPPFYFITEEQEIFTIIYFSAVIFACRIFSQISRFSEICENFLHAKISCFTVSTCFTIAGQSINANIHPIPIIFIQQNHDSTECYNCRHYLNILPSLGDRVCLKLSDLILSPGTPV